MSAMVRSVVGRSGMLRRWGRSLGGVRGMETDRTSTVSGATVVQGAEEAQGVKALAAGMTGHARGFAIKGDSVEILESPSQFYNVLLQGVRNARSRVVIASLYVGTGTLEQELLDVIAESLASKPSLQVTILCDALRTTRPSRDSSPSSAAMLANILLSPSSPSASRARVALYHTPSLPQALKHLLPARAQEILGVCHLKAFVFDDNVVMTGANMSTAYFTSRQDRYLCFPDAPALATHLCSLVSTVARYSFSLDSSGQLLSRAPYVDPVSERERFCTELSDVTASADDGVDVMKEGDTWVFPTVQMGPLDIRQDEAALLWLLKEIPGGSDVHLSSPYFNLTPEYEEALLEAARERFVHVLTAHPKANGFYGSSGISGYIPLAYSLLEEQLHKRALATPCAPDKGLSIYEYERAGWTFHAKGLWCTLPGGEEGPSVSLVGSSNLGYRSRDRDLEAQLFMFTTAPRLQQQLERERDDLFVRAAKVRTGVFHGPDRQGGVLASLALKLVKPWL